MLLPGAGRTDYVALFRLFRSTGYRGPIVVEVSTQIFSKPGYDPVVAAGKSFAALSRAMLASK
jgi:sugar phosphate isomerase/epimerase